LIEAKALLGPGETRLKDGRDALSISPILRMKCSVKQQNYKNYIQAMIRLETSIKIINMDNSEGFVDTRNRKQNMYDR
jgi:hypothetical protein